MNPRTPPPDGTAARCQDDSGASVVEYALLLALIVVVCIGAITFLGGSLDQNLSSSTSQFDAAGR